MIPKDTEIRIFPEYALKDNLPLEQPYAVISIMTKEGQMAGIPDGDKCQGVLRLYFPDLTKPVEGWTQEELFSPRQAESIWDFLEALPDIKALVVHCEVGACRSPAVGAAVAKVLGQDHESYFNSNLYVPNPLVYRIMLESWNKRNGISEPVVIPAQAAFKDTLEDVVLWRHLFGSGSEDPRPPRTP